jgi:hypothetical protein
MVDYDFYLNEYRGSSISSENWDAIERDASAKLNQYKRKYTVTATDEKSESMAVCAMAEALDYFEAVQNGAGAVQSASIGSVSVTYGTPAAGADLSPNGREKELFRCACLYLDIYRGVC